MSFESVTKFERALAEWWGAPYAVATDCCTHAVELSLRYTESDNVTVPKHTYVSIPMTAQKLGLTWQFTDVTWWDYYYLGNTNIIDGAVYWRQGGYIPDTFQCLSFQFRKPLNLGRGGAILCESFQDYLNLKAMSYDGRIGDKPWAEQSIQLWGYHYYMTPETAELGIEKLPDSLAGHNKTWSASDYPDLSTLPVFKNLNV